MNVGKIITYSNKITKLFKVTREFSESFALWLLLQLCDVTTVSEKHLCEHVQPCHDEEATKMPSKAHKNVKLTSKANQ